MNSLFGHLNSNNSFTSTQQPTPQITSKNTPNLLLQAVGAAMRGESPQEFMLKLAQTHPQLQQYDLSNLQNTAQQICQEKNINPQDVLNQIDNIINPVK